LSLCYRRSVLDNHRSRPQFHDGSASRGLLITGFPLLSGSRFVPPTGCTFSLNNQSAVRASSETIPKPEATRVSGWTAEKEKICNNRLNSSSIFVTEQRTEA